MPVFDKPVSLFLSNGVVSPLIYAYRCVLIWGVCTLVCTVLLWMNGAMDTKPVANRTVVILTSVQLILWLMLCYWASLANTIKRLRQRRASLLLAPILALPPLCFLIAHRTKYDVSFNRK